MGRNGAPKIGPLATGSNGEMWNRPGTSPVKAGRMRNLMSYTSSNDTRPLTSPVRSRRPRMISPVKTNSRSKKNDVPAAQPFFRGLFGVKGAKKQIQSGLTKKGATLHMPTFKRIGGKNTV